MKKEQRKTKFNVGDKVFEITRPQEILHITRIKDFIYFCKQEDNDKARESAFMERDLRRLPIKILPKENKKVKN